MGAFSVLAAAASYLNALLNANTFDSSAFQHSFVYVFLQHQQLIKYKIQKAECNWKIELNQGCATRWSLGAGLRGNGERE